VFHRRHDGLVERFFGQVKIADQADERGENTV
jgi:hypothetical protein